MAEQESFAERARAAAQGGNVDSPISFAARARVPEAAENPMDVARSFARSVTGQEDIEGPGLTFAERGRLSFLGDTPEERQTAFQQQFPEGEFVPIPNTDIAIFRRGRNDAFQVADPSINQALSEGRLTAETIRDLADFFGDVPELAGEVAMMGLTKGRSGNVPRKFLTDMLRLFAGGAGGSQAQQAVQTAAGTQQQDLGEQLSQSGQEGALSLVGGTLGEVAGRGINAVRGAGMFTRTPEGRAAQEAAERLGIEGGLPVAAVTESPILRRAAQQSKSVVSSISRELRDFNDRLTAAFQRQAAPADLARFTKRGLQVMREQNQKLLSTVNSVLGRGGATFEELGPVLKGAVDEWWSVGSKNHVDSMYKTARELGEPEFDIGGLQQAAQGITSRPTALSAAGQPTVQPSTVLDASGRPAGQATIPGEPGRPIPAGEVNPAVERVARKIADLDPDAPVSVDFLRALRQEIYDASLPGPNGERLLDARARSLRGAINDAMANPTNTDTAFQEAWRNADRAALDRFNTRELTAVSQLLNTDRPVAALRAAVNPGSFDTLVQLSRAMPPQEFAKLGKAFQSEILTAPGDAIRVLDEYPLATRRMLMSEAEEKAIRNYSDRWKRLENTKLQRALDDQATVQSQVSTILNNPNTRGVEDLRKLVRDTGGMRSPFGRSVRAGVMDEFLNRALQVSRTGEPGIEASAIRELFDEFKKSGVLRFLSLEDQAFLRDAESVANVLKLTEDTGTSLRAATITSGLINLAGSAISELVESLGVGRVLTSEAGKRILTGTAGTQPLDLSTIRLMGATLATVTEDVEAKE